MHKKSLTLIALILSTSSLLFGQGKKEVKPVFNQQKGIWEFELDSEYQDGPAKVEVLLPKDIDAKKQYPVIYILPVGGSEKRAFGDGIEEAKKTDFANKYGVICVSPYFTTVPWYGNNATDPKIRQEEYFLKALIPFIDSNYPTVQDKEGRWLIGFSKSGWGAYTLLMRNPEVFGYAAAWDVPFMLNGKGKNWGPMGIKKVFGTPKALQPFLPITLAKAKAPELKKRKRLVLGVGEFWKSQVEKYHQLLEDLKIPHVYKPDLILKHRWDTGWFSPMAEELEKTARAK